MIVYNDVPLNGTHHIGSRLPRLTCYQSVGPKCRHSFTPCNSFLSLYLTSLSFYFPSRNAYESLFFYPTMIVTMHLSFLPVACCQFPTIPVNPNAGILMTCKIFVKPTSGGPRNKKIFTPHADPMINVTSRIWIIYPCNLKWNMIHMSLWFVVYIHIKILWLHWKYFNYKFKISIQSFNNTPLSHIFYIEKISQLWSFLEVFQYLIALTYLF